MPLFNNTDSNNLPPIKVRGRLEENGRCSLFSPAVVSYLQGDGAAVAAILHSGMTHSLEDILAALHTPLHSAAASDTAMIVLRLVMMGVAELVREPLQNDGG